MVTALSPEDVESRLRAPSATTSSRSRSSTGTPSRREPGRYHDVCRFLRDEPELDCTYCDFTAGVDFGPDRGFEVVTLYSVSHRHNVRVSAAPRRIRAAPRSPICSRRQTGTSETMEMFGIRFEGHPQPVKLLLSEPFEGQPLRKDFP